LLLVCAGLAVLAWGIVFPSGATAQGVDVEMTELDCNSDPEMLTVENKGATPVNMTGWNLQSDPTSSESLALQSFGSLASGASLTVQSGPKAQGIVWSQTEKFRNNDPSDFAQLASDEGFVLTKVNCPASAQQTGTPAATAAPTAAPTQQAANPTATALGAVSAPQGGGPPEAAASIPPAALIALGSGLLTAGLGTFALPFGGRKRRASSTTVAESDPKPTLALPARPALETTRLARRPDANEDFSPYLFLMVIVMVVVGTLLLLLQFGGHKQK
jgi:hypothetical protein